MGIDIHTLIGEATAYDKKQMLEVRRPKSWLKSVSAFANGEGGILIFGISDDDQIMGLANAEGDAEKISEEIKSKLDPVPAVKLDLKEADGRKLVLRHRIIISATNSVSLSSVSVMNLSLRIVSN